MYVREVERLTDEAYLPLLLQDVQSDLSAQLNHLYREYPEYELDMQVFQRNQELMKYLLYPAQGLRAHVLSRSADSLQIEVGATQVLPLALEAVIWNDSAQTSLSSRRIVPGKKEGSAISFESISVVLPEGIVPNDSTLLKAAIAYKVLGSDSLRTSPLVPYPGSGSVLQAKDLARRAGNVGQFSFIDVDRERRRAVVRPGSWKVEEPIIVPKGYTLEMGAHTVIDLVRSAMILSKGPVAFKGDEAHPIRITSSDSTGQGLVVLSAPQQSTLQHVVFEHLQSVNQPDWVLTGAVTFYDTEVSFKHAQFLNNKSEDALNLVRTTFLMEDVLFEGSASDAFDADFCNGELRNATFLHPYNDAIDFSGSEVVLDQVVVKQAGDKAISAGEHSLLKGSNVQIIDSEIAIASKDLSHVKLQHSAITSARVGVAIFQKKPEYGPGSAELDGVQLHDVLNPVLLEEGSYLYLNGERQAATDANVYEMLYGNVFGRASK